MNLSRSHLIIYSLLGTIAFLIGVIINLWQKHDNETSWLIYANRKCMNVADRQDKVIRGLLR